MYRNTSVTRTGACSIAVSLLLLAASLAALLTLHPGPSLADRALPRAAASVTPTAAAPPTAGATPGPGVNGVQLFIEPTAGEQVILNAINGAQRSIDLEIYLLTDTSVIHALEQAASRGLTVRVMLEPHPYGGGSPDRTMQELSAYGVITRYTSPAFTLTHEKAMIIDSRSAYIMTCNFTRSALGGSSSTTNREYGIIDALPADVSSVSAIFDADWNRATYAPDDANLVVSPVNARSGLLDLLNGAHSSLIIEAEEMQDSAIEQALVAAQQRGVAVMVILPTPSGSNDPNASGITTLDQGGVQVREDPKLYMHAKMFVVDGQEAFVGSENFSTASLDQNRELGVLVADPQVLSTLQTTFQQDWSDSQSV